MSNYIGLGLCKKCGQDKIDVNGEIRCLVCEAEYNKPSGLVVKIDDPGEEKMNRVLAAAGVATPKVEGKATVPPKPPVSVAVQPEPADFNGKIQAALNIMQSLPMPKDIKQFKNINKVISSLEKILGEQNGD